MRAERERSRKRSRAGLKVGGAKRSGERESEKNERSDSSRRCERKSITEIGFYAERQNSPLRSHASLESSFLLHGNAQSAARCLH